MVAQDSKKIEHNAEFWTTSEFCDVVNISSTTLKSLLQEGQIKGAHKFGKQWRIHKKTFYDYIKGDITNG